MKAQSCFKTHTRFLAGRVSRRSLGAKPSPSAGPDRKPAHDRDG